MKETKSVLKEVIFSSIKISKIKKPDLIKFPH